MPVFGGGPGVCLSVVWGLGTCENCKPAIQDAKEVDTRTYVCLQFVLQMWALLDTDAKASHLQSLHCGLIVTRERAGELVRSGQARRVTVQAGEACLESCECLLSAGQGLRHVGIGMWLASTVNKRVGSIIEKRHLKFYFKREKNL